MMSYKCNNYFIYKQQKKKLTDTNNFAVYARELHAFLLYQKN